MTLTSPELSSSRKIFLDVGGNTGQTLDVVLKPSYQFDVIHCFEPQKECFEFLQNKFSDYLGGKLVLHNFGLADEDKECLLFGGGIGASLFSDKRDVDENIRETCRFVKASTFIADNILANDYVLMKLNCEGSEVIILRDLMQNNYIHSFANILIDFDVRKIPSQQHEQEKVLAEIKDVGFHNYINSRHVKWGLDYESRINSWLSTVKDAPFFMEC